MFDSEMFEWTQRPCSPEILPSPVKATVKGTLQYDTALQGDSVFKCVEINLKLKSICRSLVEVILILLKGIYLK